MVGTETVSMVGDGISGGVFETTGDVTEATTEVVTGCVEFAVADAQLEVKVIRRRTDKRIDL